MPAAREHSLMLTLRANSRLRLEADLAEILLTGSSRPTAVVDALICIAIKLTLNSSAALDGCLAKADVPAKLKGCSAPVIRAFVYCLWGNATPVKAPTVPMRSVAGLAKTVKILYQLMFPTFNI